MLIIGWFMAAATELRTAMREDWMVREIAVSTWAALVIAVAVVTLLVLTVLEMLGWGP